MRILPIAAVAATLLGCGSEPAEQRPANGAQMTPEPSGPPVVQQAQPERERPAPQPPG